MALKSIKQIIKEKPKTTNKFARKEDKEAADELEGTPTKIKKTKKSSSIVAIKHNKVLNTVASKVGKGRKMSLYQAMIDEGYSESYARSGHIKKKKAWSVLISERLADDKLSNIHSQLLVHQKIEYMLFSLDVSDKDIYELVASVGATVKKIIHGVAGTHCYFFAPDGRIRKDALELAYKVAGKLVPETIKVETTGLANLSDEELAAIIKRQKRKLTKSD